MSPRLLILPFVLASEPELFMVMEFMDDGDVATWLRTRALGSSAAIMVPDGNSPLAVNDHRQRTTAGQAAEIKVLVFSAPITYLLLTRRIVYAV